MAVEPIRAGIMFSLDWPALFNRVPFRKIQFCRMAGLIYWCVLGDWDLCVLSRSARMILLRTHASQDRSGFASVASARHVT
jgi:hypothetical protein